METIYTEKAPAAIGPYSQGKKVGTLIFASGQIPIVPETGNVVGNEIVEQAEQVMKNVGAILTAAGSSYER